MTSGDYCFSINKMINILGKPGPPSGRLRAKKVTANSVTIDWFPPIDDGGSPLTAFILEVKHLPSQEWYVLYSIFTLCT